MREKSTKKSLKNQYEKKVGKDIQSCLSYPVQKQFFNFAYFHSFSMLCIWFMSQKLTMKVSNTKNEHVPRILSLYMEWWKQINVSSTLACLYFALRFSYVVYIYSFQFQKNVHFLKYEYYKLCAHANISIKYDKTLSSAINQLNVYLSIRKGRNRERQRRWNVEKDRWALSRFYFLSVIQLIMQKSLLSSTASTLVCYCSFSLDIRLAYVHTN